MHWSIRKLGRLLKIHHILVGKAWQRAGLQPHRFERYRQSYGLDFEPKVADVIGLYVNPPDHATVFAVDEKTAIQALDRLDPVLPLLSGRVERQGFEYYRHGTLSLFAAPTPSGPSARPDRAAVHQSSERAAAFHADLFDTAQSSRTVVFEGRSGPPGAGHLYSIAALARKVRRYIHRYNKAPKPIRWAYRDPVRPIGSPSVSTVH